VTPRFIDISLPIDSALPVWPGDPPIQIRRFLELRRGDGANASSLSCSVHTGTHVDAPAHHVEGGAGVDELPLDAFIGPAMVADLTGATEIGRSELRTLRLPRGTQRLLFKTGNSKLWSDAAGEFHRDYVAITPEGAEWLAGSGVRLVGVDYLSVERFGATPPVVHHTLLGAGIVVLEGLDLSGVAPGNYSLICLPLRMRGLDGAPARAVLVEETAG
jgi:arylformamidase